MERLLAGQSLISRAVGDVMAKKIYLSQIQAKIDRLQRERKQVLEHLALVERKIETLHATIEIMQDKAITDEYDTELYTYHAYKRHFKGKLRQMLLAELKAQPDHYFTVNELTRRVLIRDGQEPTILPQHTISVRGALKDWINKGFVERIKNNAVDVCSRFKQK